MKKSNYRRTIYAAITDNKTMAEQTDVVIGQLNLDIPAQQIEEMFGQVSKDKHRIILFDYDNRKAITPYICQTSLSGQVTETVVFNVPHRIDTEKLLALGNLKGLFYEGDTIGDIEKGLNAIIDGQNWLPRHVTSQLIHYYRHVFRNQTLKATIELTSREIQILRSLQTGVSNAQMAENLFISEFTVKSHLYQIFKKISVKNRSQAISWANHNLVS